MFTQFVNVQVISCNFAYIICKIGWEKGGDKIISNSYCRYNSLWTQNAKDTEKKNWVETNISDIIKVQKNQLFKSDVAQIPKLTITNIITQLPKHM